MYLFVHMILSKWMGERADDLVGSKGRQEIRLWVL